MSDQDRILNAALSDREKHPWRYYRLDHETTKKLLDELSASLAAVQEENTRLRSREADYHDLITSLWAVVDPEQQPDLTERVHVVLGMTDSADQCGNYICGLLNETEQRAEQAEEECARLKAEKRILELAVPLEEDLSNSIDEMLKYLAMEQGFTLNGIARLLVDTQRRMAADWDEVGRERRERNKAESAVQALQALQAQIATLREYVQHKPTCPHSAPKVKLDLGPGWVSGSFVKPCTCGLAALPPAAGSHT
jgi:hypothetical protein